jgi:hypothetical protein
MLVINLLALGACGLGFAAGWRVVRRVRQPSITEEALLSWEENPAPAFRYDALGAGLIAAHAMVTMALCVLLLCSVNQVGDGPISPGFTSPTGEWLANFIDLQDMQVQRLSIFIGGLSACFGTFVFGYLLSFPISRWRIRPVLVHLHPNGILYGQTGVPWGNIGAYEIDHAGRLAKLHTHARPKTPSVVLAPASEDMFGAVERVLRDRLSGVKEPPQQERRWPPALLLCLVLLLILLGGFWLFRFVAEWTWFVYAVVIMGVLRGDRILLRI